MKQVLLVGVGGFFGSILRFGLSTWAARLSPHFPLGTVAVNLLGCFAIGLLAAFGEKRSALSPEMRLLLVTGFLGGFTTFSAFGLDMLTLVHKSKYLLALANVLLSVCGGLVAVWLGFQMVPPSTGEARTKSEAKLPPFRKLIPEVSGSEED